MSVFTIKPLLLALFLILCEAVPEGMRMRGDHKWAASIEFIYRAVVTFVCFAFLNGISSSANIQFSFIRAIIGFVLLRFAVFDLIYNLYAGNPLFYIGDTKWYDKILRRMKMPEHFWAFVKFIALVWGGAWLVNIY